MLAIRLRVGSWLLLAFLLPEVSLLAQEFMSRYQDCRESSIEHRRFKHRDVEKLLKTLPDSLFDVSVVGQSVLKKNIYMVKAGSGTTSVLLWSQMHGNEPTATMALLDIFHYLSSAPPPVKSNLLEGLTLYVIPMLNPDGADRFLRRNELGIDLNRDALRLQNPETILLKRIRDSIDADWGFNLHDQNRYTSAGKTKFPASISFLAPAYNEKKEWNNTRTKAMQVICTMNEALQKHIPNQVGRYSDAFEPRAFGDNMQKWGTSTILIETGAFKNDPEKQFLRKMNYLAIMTGLESIASGEYKTRNLSSYRKIPYNGRSLHDLVIRNANLEINGQSYICDIGLRHDEVQEPGDSTYYRKFYVADLGDLHNYFGFEEFDATGYDVCPIAIFDQELESEADLESVDLISLYSQGIGAFRYSGRLTSRQKFHSAPVLLSGEDDQPSLVDHIRPGADPRLVFKIEGEVKYLLMHGTLYDMEKLRKIHR